MKARRRDAELIRQGERHSASPIISFELAAMMFSLCAAREWQLHCIVAKVPGAKAARHHRAGYTAQGASDRWQSYPRP
jgi:hypothetical protein